MAIGIDFGTTNSAAVYEKRLLDVDKSDAQPMPSLVAIDPLSGEVKVGEEVRRSRHELQASWQVISSVKLALGHDRSIAQSQGRKLNSTDISSLIFRELRRRAEKRFGPGTANEAVVSIPVGLRADARRRIRAAADHAGTKILEFISEPTAAFLACRDQLPDCERVVVFDWGGGTLDVSVVQIEGGDVHELATASLQQAGDAIDELVAAHIHQSLTNEPLDRVRIPARQYDRLMVEAESAKCTLADIPSTMLHLLKYMGEDRSFTLSREALEHLTTPVINHCVKIVTEAIRAAQKTGGEEKIDQIVLVGGSSKLWGIESRLRQAFPEVGVFSPNRPQWAVAQGASRLADELVHGSSNAVYRLNHPVYLLLSDGTPLPLVSAGDKFNDQYKQHNLALVEVSDYAQLVLAVPEGMGRGILGRDKGSRPVDFLSVPMQGLPLERLRLQAKLTPDLTLVIRAQTEKADAAKDLHWTHQEFEQLLFSYELP